jgi:predicted AAA+ superfamily ATPase
MRYVPRLIEAQLLAAARHFPALILTGPRRAGKTTLLRKLFPGASYALLEDPDTVARARADPRAFLEETNPPAILDEIQNAPEIFNYVRTLIDQSPTRKGRWLLTGSQEAGLMKGVTESMAGRAAVFQLLPLSRAESQKVSLLRGSFPEVVAHPSVARTWFRSYVQTYLERDVRAVSSIRDLVTFRRFLALVASRNGQMLNKTDLAAPLGVSAPTVAEWLSILEVTGQVILVPPYFENFGKRLVKTPKLYFVDSGLACHLLGVDTDALLRRSPFVGPVFEGFVAAEVVKHQLAQGRAREIYYFRDQQGLEVDFVVPVGGRRLVLLEAKAALTVRPEAAASLVRLAVASGGRAARAFVVHPGVARSTPLAAVRPGVKAGTVEDLPRMLSGEP